MKASLASIAAAGWLASACATQPPAYVPTGVVVPLKNAGIESDWAPGYPCVPDWICLMHSDATAYRYAPDDANPARGKRSACVTRVKDEPWVSTIQVLYDRTLQGKRVRFSIEARVKGVTGKGAGAWIAAKNVRSGALGDTEKLVAGTQGWQRVGVEFDVPPETAELHFGAVLIGPGELCFDDAVLEILQERKSPV